MAGVKIAQRLAGARLGCTGRETPDVLAGRLAIEVKTRKRLPTWLLQAMQQALVASLPMAAATPRSSRPLPVRTRPSRPRSAR